MLKILSALAVMFLATSARALDPSRIDNSQAVLKDTVTIVAINVTSHTMVRVDTPTLDGSWYVRIESTDTTVGFCCSFDVSASTNALSDTIANKQPCMRALKDQGSGVWWMEFKRWVQNLKVFCMNTGMVGPSEVRVLQGR